MATITHQPTKLENLTPYVIDADVASPYEVELAITNASQKIGPIELWVYAVGDITSDKTAAMMPDTWQRIVDANLTGAFLTTRYSLPWLKPDAHLIYLGAVSERLRLPGLAAYAAAKAGLEAFAEVRTKTPDNGCSSRRGYYSPMGKSAVTPTGERTFAGRHRPTNSRRPSARAQGCT